MAERRLLTGWGRSTRTLGLVESPASAEEVAQALARAPERGLIARGLGRAYGDAAMNAGGGVLDMRSLRAVDYGELGNDGSIRAQAGASLHEILLRSVPHGWFLPVAPGTRYVTIGGAIAADVHGKEHPHAGSFMAHVQRLTLATPTGVRVLEPHDPLFAATFGGMGLTGVIVEAVVGMLPISSSRLVVHTSRTPDIDDALALMDGDGTGDLQYAVAWVDCTSRGAALGRAIVMRARWARAGELDPKARADPLAYQPRAPVPVPVIAPANLVSWPAARAFNELWYRRAPRERRDELQGISRFFHPQDALRDWHNVYGPAGLLQYQFVVPATAADVLHAVIERFAQRKLPAMLSTLKRFGQPSGGHLSFPCPGWALAIDVPARMGALARTLAECDRLIAECGGRVYLAKDAHLSAELVSVMYPRLDEWSAIREQADPDGVLVSDQARRLRLVRAGAR